MRTIKKAQSGATTKKKTVPMSVAKKKVDSLRYDAYTRRQAGKNRTIGSKGYDSIAKELMETAKKSDSLADVWEKNIKKAKSKPKLQKGGKVVKKKTTPHPNDDYKNMKDPKTGKKGTIGGEGTRPPFTPGERKKMPKVGNMGSAKNGKTMKKAKSGGKFPDLNKDGKITKADILVGRGVIKAKKGAVAKKTMKAGGKMTKCKYGCK